jgi:hypothetical protein
MIALVAHLLYPVAYVFIEFGTLVKACNYREILLQGYRKVTKSRVYNYFTLRKEIRKKSNDLSV